MPYPRPSLISRFSSKQEQLAIAFPSEQEVGPTPLERPSTQTKEPAALSSNPSAPKALTDAPSQAQPQISVSAKEPRFFITEDEVADARRVEQDPRVQEESKAQPGPEDDESVPQSLMQQIRPLKQLQQDEEDSGMFGDDFGRFRLERFKEDCRALLDEQRYYEAPLDIVSAYKKLKTALKNPPMVPYRKQYTGPQGASGRLAQSRKLLKSVKAARSDMRSEYATAVAVPRPMDKSSRVSSGKELGSGAASMRGGANGASAGALA